MIDIEELLRSKNIDFKDGGHDVIIKCLNPEHIDDNPSLRVDRETGAMHCLACGFGKGIPSIFHYFNQDIPRVSGKLVRVNNLIKDFRTKNISYDIPDSAIPFKDSYRKISADLFQKYHAFQQQKDWENRVVFPITDSVGNIKAFLGRIMYGEIKPKYMIKPANVPLPIFPTRTGFTSVVLVEGIFDMLNLEDKGLENVVCCFGTHQFSAYNTQEKLLPLEIAGVTAIFILLDNDKSGNASAEKLQKLISSKTNMLPIISNYLLPKDKDPGDLDQQEVDQLGINLNKLLANNLKI